MLDFCIVRQPIYDSNGALTGYEIRFRDSEDGRHAFTQSFLSGTFDIVRGGLRAFITCTRTQILDEAFQLVNPETTIVLVSREVEVDPELVATLTKFKDKGGVIGIDGLDSDLAPAEALGAIATWARIDVRREDFMVLAKICDRAASGGSRKLIADHVLEASQYSTAHELGFDCFEGEYFARPEPLPAADLPSSTVAAIKLLSLSRNPNVGDRQLEDTIAIDPVLTFQLLRLVNSAAVGARGVSSIGQALRLIGRTAFQRWLAVAIAASRKAKSGVDQQLVRQAVERGRLLEQMAGGNRDGGTLFLVGLFSLMDAVFRMPLPDLLERIALSDDANKALLERAGPYAAALELAESYELGMIENATQIASGMGLDMKKIAEMYTSSLAWTAEALGPLMEPVPVKPAPTNGRPGAAGAAAGARPGAGTRPVASPQPARPAFRR